MFYFGLRERDVFPPVACGIIASVQSMTRLLSGKPPHSPHEPHLLRAAAEGLLLSFPLPRPLAFVSPSRHTIVHKKTFGLHNRSERFSLAAPRPPRRVLTHLAFFYQNGRPRARNGCSASCSGGASARRRHTSAGRRAPSGADNGGGVAGAARRVLRPGVPLRRGGQGRPRRRRQGRRQRW